MLSPLLAALALLQFVAMAFLVIACLTAPVFHQIGLSEKSGTTYGVFGYCETLSGCSSAKAIYDVPAEQAKGDNWAFSKHSRTILGKMLIATPVAAGLNFFAFLSLMMTLVSVLLSRSGTIKGSAFAFFVNLFLTALAFLASAFVCFVVFFTFWPHTTWITWLMIPAAALPLIEVPLVFLAHSRGPLSRGSDEQEDSDDEAVGMLQREDTSFAGEKPLVLPDYGGRQEPVFKIDTASSDHSWKEKQAADERTRELSREHSFDNSYDNSYDNSNTQGAPQQAVSAIHTESRPDNLRGKHAPSISLSLGSSEYSEPMARNTDSRAVLEDIIKDTLGGRSGGQSGSQQGSDHQDAESNFTSISQRAAARSAGPEIAPLGMQQRSHQQSQQHPPMQALPGQHPMYRGEPAPQNFSNSNQAPTPHGYGYVPHSYPPRPNAQPRHGYRRPNGYMMPPRLAQQHGQPHPMAYSRPMGGHHAYQANPMAAAQPMPMARPHAGPGYAGPSQMSPPMAGGPMPAPGVVNGTSHYAPAYKKRMSAKNAIPSAAALNSTYGFR